jgi:predicted nucleic acid-binding protein
LIVDTDILIELERGNISVGRCLEDIQDRAISAQTWMEFTYGATNKEHLRRIKQMLVRTGCEVVAIDQGISHKAMSLVEDYALEKNLSPGDALIAATALQRGEALLTLNRKHFKGIRGLDLAEIKHK